MTRHTLLETDIVQGVVPSRSIPLPDRVAALVGTPLLQPSDILDPTFSCWLTLAVTYDFLRWHSVACSNPNWYGGPNAVLPTVIWSGRAARARLILDLSRPASAGTLLDVT